MKDPVLKSQRLLSGLLGVVGVAVQSYPETAPYAEFAPMAAKALASLAVVLCATSKYKEK